MNIIGPSEAIAEAHQFALASHSKCTRADPAELFRYERLSRSWLLYADFLNAIPAAWGRDFETRAAVAIVHLRREAQP